MVVNFAAALACGVDCILQIILPLLGTDNHPMIVVVVTEPFV